MALALIDDDIAEERKQIMVKNLAKAGNCTCAVKANLKMEKIEASTLQDFGSAKP